MQESTVGILFVCVPVCQVGKKKLNKVETSLDEIDLNVEDIRFREKGMECSCSHLYIIT